MADLIRFKRGTRAQLDSAATASALHEGEPYLITDESTLALGIGADDYVVFARTALDSDYGLVTQATTDNRDYGAL